mgnify:FL=1
MSKKREYNKKTISRLLSYLKQNKLKVFGILVCIIVSSLVSICSSLFLKNLLDDYIKPLLLDENPSFVGLKEMILTMGLIFLIGIIASFISSILANLLSQKILKDIRDEMFRHMQTLPISYFDTRTHGEVMSFYTNDIDAIEQLYSESIIQVTTTIITVLVTLITMLSLSIYMTTIVIITVIFMFMILTKISKKSCIYFRENQKDISKINGYIEEIMAGQKVVKVFNHEEKVKEEFDRINNKWFDSNYHANKYANILMPIMGNLANVQYVIVSLIGGLLAINNVGGITLGMIASFLQLSRSFTMPISRLAQQINSIIMALAGASRIFSLMDEESEKDDGYVTLVNVKEIDNKLIETSEKTGMWAWKCPSDNETVYVPLKGDVRFHDVYFGYVPSKKVLYDINLYAKPGQKIALVGATGAGKTTITNLLNRFYDINDGEIIYDGINIKNIKKSDLRRSLGMVLQDTNLWTGTIMENLKYANSMATDEEVYEACRLANADSFIKRLPNGYKTMITNNGGNLSQGQRQLLSIARAAVYNPPVMILDEATSSIDTRTEKLVQDGMDKLMKNRTVFVIAHRLSTIQNAKAIMVMDHGKIIERGNHEELIKQKGVYYQLYTGKFELE